MTRIHLSKAEATTVDEQYILRALRSGWIAPLGPDVEAFEAEIAERVGVCHALAVSSGTAALHLALLGVGAQTGTVVVLPSLTFAASANAVMYTGAEPVFVDSQADDGNIDPGLLLEAVDDLRQQGRKIAAVMSVDLFGRTCDYDIIEAALAERGIPLVADAAESLGANLRGRQAGSFGTASAVSFNGNKIITTSGGGMLLSNNPLLMRNARKLSTQAREPYPWSEHAEVGFNYRMSNILAALGRSQLTRLDAIIERRRTIREQYAQHLKSLPLRILGRTPGGRDDSGDNHWLTTVVLDDPETNVERIVRDLNDRDIEARHVWKPMHMQPIFRAAQNYINGTAEDLFMRGINLPSGQTLIDGEVETVATSLTDILKRVTRKTTLGARHR